LNAVQAKLEADFRYALVRLRANAEAVAFYSGEHAELQYVHWRFSKVVRNLSSMAGTQALLALFKQSFGFATLLIPSLVLAPLYFRGEVELGVVSQSSMAFRQVFTSLNLVLSKMNELAKWRSGLQRIWDMQVELQRAEEQAKSAAQRLAEQRRRREEDASTGGVDDDDDERVAQIEAEGRVWWSHDDEASTCSSGLQQQRQSEQQTAGMIEIRHSPHLRLEHLRVCVAGDAAPPDSGTEDAASGESQRSSAAARSERVLVDNLCLFLPSLQQQLHLQPSLSSVLPSLVMRNGVGGRGLLIMGGSGVGKSTLLRAIAGLWKRGDGVIHRPDLSALLFLPQRPYLTVGTLRQQLLYPFCPANQRSVATKRAPPAVTTQQQQRDHSGEKNGDASISLSSSPQQQGLRRRWPQAKSPQLLSPLSLLSSPSSASVAAADDADDGVPTANLSPSASPSPVPPTSSAALRDEAYSREGVPSDADLAHILELVNLSHLVRPGADYGRSTGSLGAHGRQLSDGTFFAPHRQQQQSDPSSSSPPSLSSVSSGLDAVCEWSDVLSLGESQRVSFARLLIHQPAFAFCDEVTAALDAHNEEQLYTALATHAPRTVLVSVGHRPALLRHHSHVLHLQPGGRWQVLDLADPVNAPAVEAITKIASSAQT
jgi:ABC-type uncharacterized transport system fused permease/ATPase subunit